MTNSLERYPPEPVPVDWDGYISITKIIVPTQRDKEQLLLAFRYLHDLRDIDTDFLAVNTLVHQYLCPDHIEVAEG